VAKSTLNNKRGVTWSTGRGTVNGKKERKKNWTTDKNNKKKIHGDVGTVWEKRFENPGKKGE